MGIPIIIPTSKEGFKQWIKVVGVLLIAAAIYFSATKIQLAEPNFVKEGTVPFSEMNKSDVYEMTDAVVFDNYATYTNNNYEYEYFTILVKDSDGYSKYASVVISAADDIYEKVMAFNKDSSLAYGECILNGGFTAVKMDDVKMDKDKRADLKKWFNEDISSCQQVLNAEASDLVLTYACASEADFPVYKENLKNENIKWGIIAAACVAGGIVCIVIGVLMSKKDKKKALAAAEANAQYFDPNAVYYNPEALAENAEAEPAQPEFASVTADAYSVLPEETTAENPTEE
ncbi:MAG: hypothetical protein K2I14_04030 [Eubacterium sp.]|nr:hypothetical protein [Eubacterium sp.]